MSNHPARLGPYPVERELGHGGMGVVYLARDPRLGRPVAIKRLSEEFARNPEHLARFEREAKTLAALNHPNIGAIYGIERDDAHGDQPLLVLEYVPGETLGDRIRRGTPVHEALDYCRQIALALEAAHERGIVHRDLKPGNVKITPDGQVKVLDFGLAKGDAANPEDLAASPTFTYMPTASGVILGTAAYMSPEQARGRPVDRRTDIWSFGCVLYECLTGRRPFDADTVSDTIARILEREVDWSPLPPATPARVRDLLRRCLEKDVRKRQRDIGDARLEIEETLAAGSSASNVVPTPHERAKAGQSLVRRSAAAVALLLLGSLLGVALWSTFGPATGTFTAPGLIRLSEIVPKNIRAIDIFLSRDGSRVIIRGVARKPDGTEIEYPQLYSRALGADEFTPIPGTEGAQFFRTSPDSVWAAVVVASGQSSQRQLLKARLDGSAPAVPLREWDPSWLPQFTWLPSDDLLAAVPSPEGWKLRRIPIGAGDPRPEVKLDTGDVTGFPQLGEPLPDGRSVFMQLDAWGPRGYQSDAWVLDTETGKGSLLRRNAGRTRYLPTGHIAFTVGSTLMAAPFDLATKQITGEVAPLEGGLRTTNSWAPAYFSVSSTGTLTFVAGGLEARDRRLVIFDTPGQVVTEVPERREYQSSLVRSLDGQQVSLVIPNVQGTFETWTVDLVRSMPRKAIALPDADSHDAVLSPSRERLAFTRTGSDGKDGIYLQRIAGETKGEPKRVMAGRQDQNSALTPSSWAPDGSGLIVSRLASDKHDLLFLPLSSNDVPGQPRDLLVTAHDENDARFSDDGRLVAFLSDMSGALEAYVARYGKDGVLSEALRVSKGATGPVAWDGGRRLFYGNVPERVMVVTIRETPELAASSPVLAYDLRKLRVSGDQGHKWDILPNGRLIGIQKGDGEDDVSAMTVVLNWLDAIKTRLASQVR